MGRLHLRIGAVLAVLGLWALAGGPRARASLLYCNALTPAPEMGADALAPPEAPPPAPQATPEPERAPALPAPPVSLAAPRGAGGASAPVPSPSSANAPADLPPDPESVPSKRVTFLRTLEQDPVPDPALSSIFHPPRHSPRG